MAQKAPPLVQELQTVNNCRGKDGLLSLGLPKFEWSALNPGTYRKH